MQELKITLLNASGNGRIDENKASVRLNVLPNSNPYGLVSFTNTSYTVYEETSTTQQLIQISRKSVCRYLKVKVKACQVLHTRVY